MLLRAFSRLPIPGVGRTGEPAADHPKRGAAADRRSALRIAGAYFLVAGVWIALSDRALDALGPQRSTLAHTLKGWAFVMVTAVLLYFLVLRTLAARRRAREAKRESARFLRTLIANLPGVVYQGRNDACWTMEYLSAGVEELSGYRPEELVGDGPVCWADLVHPDDRERVWEEVQAAVERGRPFHLEYRVRTRDGHTRWVSERGRAVPSEAGERGERGERAREAEGAECLEGFIADVTNRKLAEEGLRRRIEQLRALRAIDLAITGSLDLRVALNVILDQVTARLEVDAAGVLLLDRHSRGLEYAAGRGFRADALRFATLRLGEGFAGQAARERRIVFVEDLRRQPGAFSTRWLLEEEGFVSYLGVPLVAKGHVKGVLEIFHRRPLKPDPEWKDFLDTLAGQAAIALDNAGLFDELERAHEELALAYEETIEGWARALDLRDRETEGHSRRVTELTLRLGRAMGMSEQELVHVRRGAHLHDIGKMGIPDHILLKPGPLTEEEWEVMRRHPAHAYELLSPIEFLRPALEIPYCHHEKWDGTGYPRGLRGKQIPLAARVFAVADVWDALRSDRPYRAAWPERRAREHIRQQAGKHFDPEVVAAFLELVPEREAKGSATGEETGTPLERAVGRG